MPELFNGAVKKLFEHIESHFLYTKRQRNGILLLFCLICTIQLVYHHVDFRVDAVEVFDNREVLVFQKRIDSLKQLAIQKGKPKIYPFNPNFISDYKGYQLGMSIEQIDRLHQFRKQKKFVNSAMEFQEVTKISDSLLNEISVYFKFPSWVRNKKNKNSESKMTFNHEVKLDKTLLTTTDLNQATLTDFLVIEGVDDAIAERIIKYRTKLQGFVFENQIQEVWGLETGIAEEIMEVFSVETTPKILKINVNTASFKEVLKNPYIDYDLCVKIFEYRDEVAELQDISELKNIEGFPIDKYDRIVVYLLAR